VPLEAATDDDGIWSWIGVAVFFLRYNNLVVPDRAAQPTDGGIAVWLAVVVFLRLLVLLRDKALRYLHEQVVDELPVLLLLLVKHSDEVGAAIIVAGYVSVAVELGKCRLFYSGANPFKYRSIVGTTVDSASIVSEPWHIISDLV